MGPESWQLRLVREQNHKFSLAYTLDSYSSRIRVESYRGNLESVSERACEIADANQFSKVILRVHTDHLPYFISRGFTVEAVYQQFLAGHDAWSVAKFFDAERRTSPSWMEEEKQLQQILKQPVRQLDIASDSYTVRLACAADSSQLVQLYQRVFEVYPTPVHDAKYIEELMKAGAIFVVAEAKEDGAVISAASAHVDTTFQYAEIAECVTLPEFRKQGLMKVLISQLHENLRSQSIFVSIANARSKSFGMNSTFHQLGYTYGGRLLNHCIIYEGLEDLNVWMKDLSVKDIYPLSDSV